MERVRIRQGAIHIKEHSLQLVNWWKQLPYVCKGLCLHCKRLLHHL
jgi:hypothetical protein